MAGLNRRRWSAGGFTTLVGRRAVSYDPTAGLPKPATVATAQLGVIVTDGKITAGVLVPTSPGAAPTGCTGNFTVSSNTFTGGVDAFIQLGDYILRSNIDFIPGGSASLTATAIANAIKQFPGFTAGAVGAVVTVTWKNPMDDVEFNVLNTANNNFTALSPSNGFLAKGSPVPGEVA
jgi:hypothetical protein